MPSTAGGQETQRAAQRGVVAPHSADTETSRRLQLPYLLVQAQSYVIFLGTSTRVMEINYFLNIYNYWF